MGSKSGRVQIAGVDAQMVAALSGALERALGDRGTYYSVKIDPVGRVGETLVSITGAKGHLPLIFGTEISSPGISAASYGAASTASACRSRSEVVKQSEALTLMDRPAIAEPTRTMKAAMGHELARLQPARRKLLEQHGRGHGVDQPRGELDVVAPEGGSEEPLTRRQACAVRTGGASPSRRSPANAQIHRVQTR